MTRERFNEFVMSLNGAWLDYPFGENIAVYKVGDAPGKMMAIVHEDTTPLRVSLKCDPQLAEILRDKYETVVPGYHLNKRHWNTIVCTGQLADDEFFDLVRHSYELVKPS